jgi:acetylornithine deacetylase/succinyl-diaminopimelate desuccinylase-like protein
MTGMELRERRAFEPTSNIAGLLSGYTGEGVKTVLPARAMAKMDFRLVPNQDPDAILAKLRAHLKSEGFDDVQVTKLGGAEPVVTPMEHPFVQRILQISENFAGKPPSVTPIVGGTLPLLGALRRYVGVPGLMGPGNAAYWASGAHAPNEHVRLSDIDRAVRFNCYMFDALGQA